MMTVLFCWSSSADLSKLSESCFFNLFIICFCSEVSVMTFFTWHGWKQCFAFWLCNSDRKQDHKWHSWRTKA